MSERAEFCVHNWDSTIFDLQLKHNILSDIYNPILMNDIDASLQNTILRCLYAVYNMIKTMCHKVSIPIHRQFHHYVYNSPICIKDRP